MYHLFNTHAYHEISDIKVSNNASSLEEVSNYIPKNSFTLSSEARTGHISGLTGYTLPVSRVTPSIGLPYPDQDPSVASDSGVAPGRRVVKRAKIKRTRAVSTITKSE